MMQTGEEARGKWRGILAQLGVPEQALTGKHGPCPKCGGTDRFRFDNRQGKGSWICSVCGAGDGFRLLENLFGWDFKRAAAEVDAVVGAIRPQNPKPEMSEEARKRLMRQVWTASKPIRRGDTAESYLRIRGLILDPLPADLRCAELLQHSHGAAFPAMVAVVRDASGQPVQLHRTYLQVGGVSKAPVDCQRKLMPGTVPHGSAVRLFDPVDGHLGIAEGIETALAAGLHFGMPVWAALNASLLAAWSPPEGVERVTVYGDRDGKQRAGQRAAYALAARLIGEGIDATVELPSGPGRDWLDEYVDAEERRALEAV